MLVRVEVSELREALNKILSVVDKKNSRVILSYVNIIAKNNNLELLATDLEVSAKLKVSAIVENSGNLCVNARNIFDIVRELPDQTVSLELISGQNTLKITCGNIHYSVLIYTNEEFPHLQFDSNNNFEINSDKLLEVINKTSHAISNDETRLFLNGIFLQEIDSKLRAVATDGYRLALIETEVDVQNIDTLINGIIIPKKGVTELKKLAENFIDKKLQLSVDDSFIYASCEDKYYLSIRLIAKEYLKYQAVIPKKTTYTAEIEKSQLQDAVRRIKIMANERSNAVKLAFRSDELIISANHPSLGEATEKIAITYSGKEIDIGFNAKFILEMLPTFESEEICLEFNNELSPILIKSHRSNNYLGIIMPLKL